ncbi:MAG: HepT-like ribonuclease domain-containing protein [Ktedonobacterales bacterium]
MSAEVAALLQDIGTCARLIMQYTTGLTQEEFSRSIQTQDAVLRRIEIIGEAVKSLPSEFTLAHPDIPWRDMARMRDLLIHRYFSVDLELTWKTATEDVPGLERQVHEVLDSLSE